MYTYCGFVVKEILIIHNDIGVFTYVERGVKTMTKKWKAPKLIVLVRGLPGELALLGCLNQYPSSGRGDDNGCNVVDTRMNCSSKCSGTR